MAKDAIKVILVDNEEVFREGLGKLLNEQPHIVVVYQCNNSSDAIRKSQEIKPDVVLVDGHLADGSILETISKLSQSSPDIKVAILSRAEAEATPIEALKAGAKAYLAKSISLNDMIKSIEFISSGRIIISNIFAQQFLEEISAPKPDSINLKTILSEREIEITRLVVQGDSNREISNKLFISESTAKVHIRNILGKLKLKNRQQLAVYAVMQNWVKSEVRYGSQILDPVGNDQIPESGIVSG